MRTVGDMQNVSAAQQQCSDCLFIPQLKRLSVHKASQTNQTGLCLRSLPSQQDRAQPREAERRQCTSARAEQQRQRWVGQGQGWHRSPPRVCTHLPGSQAPSGAGVPRESFWFHSL